MDIISVLLLKLWVKPTLH